MLYNETPTKGFVMSTETNTNASDSKKSFITRLAENVAAKKNANESDETVTHQPDEAAAKRALKLVGATAVGLAALGTAAYVIVKTVLNEETDAEDETEENDSED